jgi:hypothetical protein
MKNNTSNIYTIVALFVEKGAFPSFEAGYFEAFKNRLTPTINNKSLYS